MTELDDAIADDAAEARRGRLGWPSLTVAILFALFYVYDLWEAISTMIELPGAYELFGLDPADIPWWLLIVNLLLPVVVYAAAFLLGLRRNIAIKALLFAVGLALVAALSLGIVAVQGALLS